MEWIYLVYASQLFLGGLGMFVSLNKDWSARHKGAIMMVFFIVTVGSLAAGKKVGEQSQAKLAESNTKLQAAIKRGNEQVLQVQQSLIRKPLPGPLFMPLPQRRHLHRLERSIIGCLMIDHITRSPATRTDSLCVLEFDTHRPVMVEFV